MTQEDSDLRRRTAAKQEAQYGSSSSRDKSSKSPERKFKLPEPVRSSFGVVDTLRIVFGLALLSTAGSYLVTRGGSYTWGFPRPWWTKPAGIKSYFETPVELTPAELTQYDGATPGKPIYVALNRTIYDVSASPHVYGPGGMYSTLAAKDASRSYITTCFDPVHDLVPWLNDTEEVYVPLWLSKRASPEELDQIVSGEVVEGLNMKALIDQVKKKMGHKKTRVLQEEAYEKARKRVEEQVRTWEGMFHRKEYPVVGRVVGVDEEDKKQWEGLKYCEAALKQRPSMAESLTEAMKLMGRPDGKVDIGQQKGSGEGKGPRDGIPVKDSKGAGASSKN